MDTGQSNDLLPSLVKALGPLLGALLVAVASYLAIKRKGRVELLSQFRKALHSERLAAYREIWKALEPLALYAPPADVTLDSLKTLERDLSERYFAHGIFLSTEGRDRYFLLQDALQHIIAARTDAANTAPLRSRDDRFTLEAITERERDLGLDPGPKRGRKARAAAQKRLQKTVKDWVSRDEDHADFHLLRFLGSQLRTQLAEDLEARHDIWAGLGAREG